VIIKVVECVIHHVLYMYGCLVLTYEMIKYFLYTRNCNDLQFAIFSNDASLKGDCEVSQSVCVCVKCRDCIIYDNLNICTDLKSYLYFLNVK